jgi:hypothetical protein
VHDEMMLEQRQLVAETPRAWQGKTSSGTGKKLTTPVHAVLACP